jgi:hypothetical protein
MVTLTSPEYHLHDSGNLWRDDGAAARSPRDRVMIAGFGKDGAGQGRLFPARTTMPQEIKADFALHA